MIVSSSSSSLHQQQTLLTGPAHSSGGSHATDTSSTAGSGSYASKDKSLDATPSPDAPRTLHLHVGSSQENVTDGGESSDGGGAKGMALATSSGKVEGGGGSTSELSAVEEKRETNERSSPLVRMKPISTSQELERTNEGGVDVGVAKMGGAGNEPSSEPSTSEKGEESLCDRSDSVDEGERRKVVSPVKEGSDQDSVIRLTPPPREGSRESLEEEEGEQGKGEEIAEREGEEDGMTTEDDETDDDELDEEEEEEEEEDDSISPVKEILINVDRPRLVSLLLVSEASLPSPTIRMMFLYLSFSIIGERSEPT